MKIGSVGTTAFVLGVTIVSFPALAQEADDRAITLQEAIGDPENLTVSGEARIRFEALENQFRPNLDRNSSLVTMRIALAAEYDGGPLRIGGELYDARAYGGSAGGSIGTGEVNALEVLQAYIGLDLDDVFDTGADASVTAGRFTLNLGSRRLVARNNFRNTTNAFTGLRLDVKRNNKQAVTGFFTFPQQRLPNDQPSILMNSVELDRQGDDLIFYGAFGTTPVRDAVLELYFYGLNEKDRPIVATPDRRIFTSGARLFRAPKTGQFDYQVEYAFQFGERSVSTASDAVRQDVSAHVLHLETGYRFDIPKLPRIAITYDFASGDGDGDKFGRFDSLFGARRFDYGPTALYGVLGRSNISAPGLDFELQPTSRIDGHVKYRALWLDSSTDAFANSSVRDPFGQSGTFAGHQIEARARYWFVPGFLRVDTGAAMLLNGPFLNNAPNANGFGSPLYGYVDLTATF